MVGPRRLGGEGRLPLPPARRALLVAALALMLACTREAPEPTPPRATLILPTAIPTPGQNAALQFVEDPDEVEAAFHAEVEQVIAQAQRLAGAPCDRLSGALAQDPDLVTRLQGLATTLRRLAPTDQALDRQATPFLLKRMDDALAELDLKVATCRIR
jgi:hypothetical protein